LTTALMAVVTAVIMFPVGPYVHVVGVIERIGYSRNSPAAFVEADDRLLVIKPVPNRDCVAGSLIRLERQRRIWGYSFVADAQACGR
jgi:hypothetical protein